MLKIENVVLPSPQQWESVIRGARNPMNSWNKMDSTFCADSCDQCEYNKVCNAKSVYDFDLGNNDLSLLTRLSNAGKDHRKYMRMLPVICDIVAPDYFFKEFDTYRVGVTENSTSTMHRIHAKEFTLDDFSTEHLSEDNLYFLGILINSLNVDRDMFIDTKDKHYWWQMIQMLPMSYNYRRTVSTNYEVLANMYHSRRNHKLDEWHTFCDFIESLPYSELITGELKK